MTAAVATRKPRESVAEREARRDRQRGKANAMMLPGMVAERARIFDERAQALGRGVKPTPPGKICNSNVSVHYSGSELSEPAVRINTDDHMKLPSLRFGMRHYRDGRVTE